MWLSPTLSKSALNVTPVGGTNTPVLLVVHLAAVPVPALVQNSVVMGQSSAVASGLQLILVAMTKLKNTETKNYINISIVTV